MLMLIPMLMLMFASQVRTGLKPAKKVHDQYLSNTDITLVQCIFRVMQHRPLLNHSICFSYLSAASLHVINRVPDVLCARNDK